MTFQSIEDLYSKYSWRSPSKFIPIATKHGFTADEAREFLKKGIEHDVIPKKPSFMHIYSRTGNEYQMDTFINDKSKGGLNYLIFININTRKAYAYSMKGKVKESVLAALNMFIHDVPDVKSIVSDQDTAYLSDIVLSFMKQHGISYRTTEDNNHNVLGIINRFMRTIRDYFQDNRKIEPSDMVQFMETYNNSPHRSLNERVYRPFTSTDDITPNEMTKKEEESYIKTISSVNPYKFHTGDTVKIINVTSPFQKKRRNVSNEAYTIDSRSGNQFIIKAADDSIDKYPGYRLVKTKSTKLAETIKGDKRGIVESIDSYDSKKNRYHVTYQGGVKDTIPAKNLREGAPTQLSSMEIQYWSTQKEIPSAIMKWA